MARTMHKSKIDFKVKIILSEKRDIPDLVYDLIQDPRDANKQVNYELNLTRRQLTKAGQTKVVLEYDAINCFRPK